MRRTGRIETWLWLLGAGLLACVTSWTALSRQFIFGVGHAERPILLFLFFFGLAWLLFAVAIVKIGKAAGKVSLVPIMAVALLARLILLPSELIQENDVYRYVLDGQVLALGGNPYEFSPWNLVHEGPERVRSSLGTEEAQLVLSRVGYPQIPTVYPPLAQAVFAGGVFIGGWHWKGQRSILLLFDLLTILCLIALVDLMAIGRGWVALYAWNPLILKEVVNSAHIDGLVAFWLTALLAALILYSRTCRPQWLIVSACSFSAAILSKLVPLVLLPAIMLFLWRRSGRISAPAWFAGIVLAMVGVGFLPFAGIGWSLFTGLLMYARDWQMNEGFFTVLSQLTARPRVWAAAIVCLVAVLLPLFQPAGSGRKLGEHFQWILLCWFLVMPAVFPWYAVPLLALGVTAGNQPLRFALLVLSGVTGLYYLRFYIEYHELPASFWTVTRLLEHALIWLALASGWFLRHHLPGARLLGKSAIAITNKGGQVAQEG